MFNGREISDYLNDIKSAIAEIEEFTSGMDFEAFAVDRKTVNAVVRSLEVLGEATKHIPTNFRRKHPDAPWSKMAGMREHITSMTTLTRVETVVVERLLESFPHLVAIYLHGSAAKGQMRAESDIDIALLFGEKEIPDRMKLFFLAPVIEEAVGRRVDLSIMTTENTVFAKEVLVNGKQLFCSDTMLSERFSMYVFSFYGKLNDERAEIISLYQAH